jgi:hypothetical protein
MKKVIIMDKETSYLRVQPSTTTGKPEIIQAIAYSKQQSRWLLIDSTEQKVTMPLSSGLASDLVEIWGKHGQLQIGA